MKCSKLRLALLSFVLIGLCSCAKRPNETNKEVTTNLSRPSHSNSLDLALANIRVAVGLNQKEEIRLIISKNIELQDKHLNYIFDDGETLLTYAVLMDAHDAIDTLLELGADINVTNAKSETPLILAAKTKKQNSLSKLVSVKARLDDRDLNGNTALIWTVQNALENDALMLISKGANVEMMNNDNKDATTYASEVKLNKVLELLTTRNQVAYGSVDASSFIKVITLGDYKTLSRMVSVNPKLIYDYEDVNPLVLVLGIDDVNMATRMADFLLTYGAGINGPKNATTSPLIRAVDLEKINFVTLYLDERADPNALDMSGKSALIHAVEKNNFDIVNLLVRHYAEKKYAYMDKQGKKQSFNSCLVARQTFERLDNPNDLIINEKIREKLKCAGRWRFR